MIDVVWWDAETNEEFEGIMFYQLEAVPRIGDELHFWQDGEPSLIDPETPKVDARVERVRHDLRYLHSRNGQGQRVQTVEIWLRRFTPPEPSP